MDHRTVVSTSRHSAVTNDIVLRETSVTRLVFRPTIVDNPNDRSASVDGTFVFQRKRPRQEGWDDIPGRPLSTLKAEDEHRLTLKAGELRTLYMEVSALYELHEAEGIPFGETRFVRLSGAVQELATMSDQDLSAVVTGSQALGGPDVLARIIRWASRTKQLKWMLENLEPLGPELLSNLTAAVGIANLKSALKVWLDNRSNRDEEFWQSLIARQPFILEQVFAIPVAIIAGKVFVGGKDFTNRGGNIADFLVRNNVTRAASLVEIKTPMSRLLGAEYRNNVFGISADLNGAVMQVLNYRESLVKESSFLGIPADVISPRCLVLVGNATTELDSLGKRRCFEIFRRQLHDVEVVAYDEMFERTRGLIQALGGQLDDSSRG